MQKPAHGGRGGRIVEFTDYLWIKFFVLVGLAFLYGLWKGITGR
jgi:hypothetical protein